MAKSDHADATQSCDDVTAKSAQSVSPEAGASRQDPSGTSSSVDAMTDDQLKHLADTLHEARTRLRRLDPQHPAVLDVGYALKAFAQWRSLDMPSRQRPALGRELRSAAESCGTALGDPELTWLADEPAFDLPPARS